jgi:hypothetical protein
MLLSLFGMEQTLCYGLRVKPWLTGRGRVDLLSVLSGDQPAHSAHVLKQLAMARQRRTVLLLALAAVAVHHLAVSAAAAEEPSPLQEQPKISFGRKLLQPFTLALQPITRVTSNAGRVTEKRIIANNNDVVAPAVSAGSLLDRE